MTDDALHDRGKAMEDVFFHDVDQKLLDKMKAELSASENRSALMAATGIDNEEAISQLMEQGISVETMAGIGLIPLVAVAWADGKMDASEREAILKATRESGITENCGSYALVESWLKNRPSPQLLASWKEYIRAVKSSLDPASVDQIRKSIIGRARDVANAAGGFLGIGKTSAEEKQVIDELNAAFK